MNKNLNYDYKAKLSSNLFWVLAPMIYYIDIFKKFGVRTNRYSPNSSIFDLLTSSLYWKNQTPTILMYIACGVIVAILLNYSLKIQNQFDQSLKKFIPFIGIIISIGVIVGNAAVFGSRNEQIMQKVGVSFIFFLISLFFTFKKSVNTNE